MSKGEELRLAPDPRIVAVTQPGVTWYKDDDGSWVGVRHSPSPGTQVTITMERGER